MVFDCIKCWKALNLVHNTKHSTEEDILKQNILHISQQQGKDNYKVFITILLRSESRTGAGSDCDQNMPPARDTSLFLSICHLGLR